MIEDNETAKIREAVVSGIFYPEDASELKAAVTDALEAASSYKSGVNGILSPHAGFEYSGAISAAAWMSAADCHPETVVILAPYHRAEESIVWLPESEIFQTPLGNVPVNRRYIEELESCGTIFQVNDIPHFEEHGIEVQLPFLQILFPNVSLVPILLGKPTFSAINSLANSLSVVFADDAESILFVVSSNFSCYPSVEDSEKRIKRVLGYISTREDESLYEEYKRDTPDMCGVGCLASFMHSRLLSGTSWNFLDKNDSAIKRASSSEKVVYYVAGAWK